MKHWAGKGSLAIVDQAFISGANFVVSILLARWTSSSEYGAFALAFAIFLLLSQLHQSLLLEPMSVFGGSYSGSRLKRYYGSLLHMQNGVFVAVAVPLALTAAVCSRFARGHELGAALWGVTLSAPFVLLFWMARRAFYLEHAPGRAAAGAITYGVVTLVGLFLVRRNGHLTPFLAFAVMGAAALITSAAMFLHLRPRFSREAQDLTLRLECRQHWHYGRWALAGALAMWIPQNVYYAVLTGADGMSAAADIRALLNFAAPLQRITVALGFLLLPYMALCHSDRGRERAKALTRVIVYLFLAGSLVYWALVLVFQKQLLHVLYDGKYSSIAHFLPWLAVSSILNTGIAGLVVGLRAMRSPASVFYAYGASAIVALVLGIPATWIWGVAGVLFAFIVSNVATLAVAAWMILQPAAPMMMESADPGLPLEALRQAKAS
ncbi:MAG TPA: hypothetical protein VFQ00_03455 [Terriglobales bacterium]|nr:hypothetical protein [Terriglobales bacterium]